MYEDRKEYSLWLDFIFDFSTFRPIGTESIDLLLFKNRTLFCQIVFDNLPSEFSIAIRYVIRQEDDPLNEIEII